METIRSPFKFLDPYTLKDRKIFFGRSQEIETLYKMAFQTDIMLIYGRSGTGKTSLVQCGLGNRFNESDWFDIFVRKGKDINASLHQALANVAKTPLKKDVSVVQMVKSVYLDYFRPVYLLFDQFEELFILGTNEEQDRFIEDIDRLIKADLNCKIILIMREEYLARLDKFEKKIPSLFSKRYRVEPMTHANVGEVITGSCHEFGIALEEPDIVVSKIIENVKDEQGEIPLAYLQVYLDQLYKVVKRKGAEQVIFTPVLVDEVGGISGVLGTFLNEQEKELQEELKQKDPDLPRKAVRTLLNQFVSVEGTKQPMNLQEIKVAHLSDDQVRFCLQFLENNRILRSKEENYELAHDTLAKHIAGQRDAKEVALLEVVKVIQDRLAINEKWQETYTESKYNLSTLRKKLIQFDKKQNFLSRQEIQIIEFQRQDLEESNRLSSEEWAFINESKHYHKKRRNRWIGGLAVFITLLSVVSAMSIIFGIRALKNEKLANYNLARLYEERASAALADGNRMDAWLYTLEALHLNSDYELPKSMNRLMESNLQPRSFYQESSLKLTQSINRIQTTKTINQVVLSNSKQIFLRNPIRDSLVNELSFYVEDELLLFGFPTTPFDSLSEIRVITSDPSGSQALIVFRDTNALKDDPALLDERVYRWQFNDASKRTPFIVQYARTDPDTHATAQPIKATAVEISPTGKYFAVGRSDESVAIYPMEVFEDSTPGFPQAVIATGNRILDIKFSPDEETLAISDDAGNISFYTLDGTPVKQVIQAEEPVQEIQFAPALNQLAGVSFNRGISFWPLSFSSEPLFIPDSIITTDMFLVTPKNILIYATGNVIHLRDLLHLDHAPIQYIAKGAILFLSFDPITNRLYYITSNKELNWINFNLQLLDDQSPIVSLDTFLTNFGSPWSRNVLDVIYQKSFDELGKFIDASYLKPVDDSLVYLANHKYYGMELRLPKLIDFASNDVINYRSSKDNDYPKLYRDSVVLTPDGISEMASAVFLRSSMQPPFTIRFDYLMRNKTGPYPNGHWQDWPADGLVLMLFKDSTAYRKQIPYGNSRGFILDNTGYGLHFATFNQNDILLMDGAGNLIYSVQDAQRSGINPPVFTDGNEWRHVQVQVSKDQISVQYACGRSFTWRGTLDLQFQGIGFAAGTGGANARHLIRNVRIDPDLIPAFNGNASITGNRVSVRSDPVINGTNIMLKLDAGAQVMVLDSVNSRQENVLIAKQSTVVELDEGGAYNIIKGKGMEMINPNQENGRYHVRLLDAHGRTVSGTIAVIDVVEPELKWYKIESPCIGGVGYVYAPYVAYHP